MAARFGIRRAKRKGEVEGAILAKLKAQSSKNGFSLFSAG
jgi:hypothetical protein